jgi:hypothetical protein
MGSGSGAAAAGGGAGRGVGANGGVTVIGGAGEAGGCSSTVAHAVKTSASSASARTRGALSARVRSLLFAVRTNTDNAMMCLYEFTAACS